MLFAAGFAEYITPNLPPEFIHTHQNPPEPAETFRNRTCLWNLPEPAQEPRQEYRNFPKPPELASGTYAWPCRNLPEPTQEPRQAHWNRNPTKFSGTFNVKIHTSIHRNSSEPSGTCPLNLRQHISEPFGTLRNLPPEPTRPHRNSPSPESSDLEPGTLRNFQNLPTPTQP